MNYSAPFMAYVLLGVAQTAGLLLLPFWTAGIWLQLGSLVLYGWWANFAPVGWVPLLVLLGVAVAAEIADPLVGGRIATKTRRRGGTGGLAGAALGALAGLAVPLVGSLFGALLGALVGAGIATFTGIPARSGCLSAFGQAVALAVRATAAVGIAAFALYSVWA